MARRTPKEQKSALAPEGIVTFYRQARADGAIRTGLDINNENFDVLENENSGNEDPALLWFVDMKFEGALPTDFSAVCHWLLKNETPIRVKMISFAAEIHSGLDINSFPARKAYKLENVKVTVSCSAVRREDALKIAGTIRAIARDWRSILGTLSSATCKA